MSCQLTYCPHPLTLDGRRVVPVRPGLTVRESLALVGAPQSDCLAAQLNGKAIDLAEDGETVLQAHDVLAARVVLQGGGDCNPLQAVLSVSLPLTAPAAAPRIAAGMGIPQELASGIYVATGNLASNALLPATPPRLPASLEAQPSSTYSLGGSRNNARLYSPHPLLLGKHRFFPDMSSRPYQDYDESGNEYLVLIFNAGYGITRLDELKIGENSLDNYEQHYLLNLGGTVVSETENEMVSHELVQAYDLGRYINPVGRGGVTTRNHISSASIRTSSAVSEGELNVPAGCGISLSAGGSEVNLDNSLFRTQSRVSSLTLAGAGSHDKSVYTEYRFLREDLRLTVGEILDLVNARDGTALDKVAIIADVSNFNANVARVTANLRLGKQLQVHANVHTQGAIRIAEPDSWTTLTTEGKAHKIGLDFIGRLYRINDSGGVSSHSVSYKLQYRLVGEQEWLAMPGTTDDPSIVSLANDSLETHRKGWRFEMPAVANYEVRISRVNPSSEDAKAADELTLSMKSYRPDNANHEGQARFAMIVKATEQLNGVIDELNGVGTSKCASYDAAAQTWVEDQETSNPADLFRYFALGGKDASGRLLWGCGMTQDELDMASLEGWHGFCDSNDLECNVVLDQSMSAAEALEVIARCGRATTSWQSGKLGAVWDEPDQPIVAMFSPENILAGSFSVSYRGGEADEIETIYVDRERGWQQQNIRLPINEGQPIAKTLRRELFGVTNPVIARDEAELAVNSTKHRQHKAISWEASIEGLVISRGDIVLLSHDMTNWGTSGRCLGDVIEDNHSQSVSVKANRDLIDGEHALVYTGGKIHSAVCGSNRTLLFVGADKPIAGDGVARDWHFVAGPQETPGQRVKIVSVVPLDSHKVRITAVPEETEYYETSRVLAKEEEEQKRLAWPHWNEFLQPLAVDSIPISTPAELAAMQSGNKYHLANDIDLTGFNWRSIGLYKTNLVTDITLDGRHHKIIGLSGPLFDYVTNLTVRNLQFVKANIQRRRGWAALISTSVAVGSLTFEQVSTCPLCSVEGESSIEDSYTVSLFAAAAGFDGGTATFRNIYGRGTITVTGRDHEGGGLIGVKFGSATVLFENCWAEQHVVFTQPTSIHMRSDTIGSICNIVGHAATFRDCHSDITHELPTGSAAKKTSIGRPVHANIRQLLYENCSYSGNVHEPDLSQGTVISGNWAPPTEL